MRINTNIASMNAQEQAANTNKALSSSLEKLSSGLKINKAADDASGLAIADKLRTQASSLNQGIANGNSASALIQIADKAMAEQSNILDTVKQKLIQASTSTTSDNGREAIRKDISKLLEQFDQIASQTNYNGTTLLQKGSDDTAKADTFSFQLGESENFDVTMTQGIASNTDKLGGGTTDFGATSINSSVAAADVHDANSLGGAQYGNGTAGDNNLKAFEAQQISTSGDVLIQSASFDSATGTEGLGGQSLDITLGGDVGKITFGAGATTSLLDISSETEEVQNAVKAIVNEMADADVEINTDGNISISASGKSLDFDGIEFSSLKIELNEAGQTASIKLNDDGGADTERKTFTITNNYGQNQLDAGKTFTDTELADKMGQLNIQNESTFDMTGGQLLSNLKSLKEDELTSAAANDFMQTIDTALTQLNGVRSDFGSTQNQIQSSIRNMQTTHTNLKNAEAVIRDTDYALESANFNKQNIIAQAGTYAMSQANAMAQNVQRLLQ